jgi:hypothetical protein
LGKAKMEVEVGEGAKVTVGLGLAQKSGVSVGAATFICARVAVGDGEASAISIPLVGGGDGLACASGAAVGGTDKTVTDGGLGDGTGVKVLARTASDPSITLGLVAASTRAATIGVGSPSTIVVGEGDPATAATSHRTGIPVGEGGRSLAPIGDAVDTAQGDRSAANGEG